MEPKFQSSFIPKGPIAASGSAVKVTSKSKSLLGFLSTLIFIIAVVLCAGVFGYNKYLSYHIAQTGSELQSARANLDASAVEDLIRLDMRLNSTSQLLQNHTIVSPLFEFLEETTLKSVRFTEFAYSYTDKGIELRMGGKARGYAAVALQSEAFSRSPYFKDPVFSDLKLDEEGNVVFTFRAVVDPTLVSYRRVIEREALEAKLEPVSTLEETATSTSESATGTTTTTQTDI